MIHLLIPYALLALGMAGNMALFLSLKREIQAGVRENRKRMTEMTTQLAEREPQTVFVPATPRSGLNLNKRIQALRMVRRNIDISHIAAAIGVPRKEVELLIRVQGIVTGHAAKATAGSN